MKFQDGTHASEFTEMDVEKQRWLSDVMAHYTQDFGKRMATISQGLGSLEFSQEAVEDKEKLLQELTEICESIDFARGTNIVTDMFMQSAV